MSLYHYIDVFESELPQVEPQLYQLRDVTGKKGATKWQKIFSSLRRLAEGASYLSLDDQARMSVESMRSAFYLFLKAMKACYGEQYLNKVPKEDDYKQLKLIIQNTDFLAA